MNKLFLKDVNQLLAIKTSKKYQRLILEEYPFDQQLLACSPLYRKSREFYLSQGGIFSRKICSTMRSLSALDLFKNEIEYTPAQTEIYWFKDHWRELADPDEEIKSLMRFNDISLFHEQNHRVLWRLLPPAPEKRDGLRRYLNLAESLVVALDIALGDELGPKLSAPFERMNLVYRPCVKNNPFKTSKKDYRRFLNAVFVATYYNLELMHPDDIIKAVNYVLPEQLKINKLAVKRSAELNELFTRITNIEWQKRYLITSSLKLKKIHAHSTENTFNIAADPLDLNYEFSIASRVFDYYGL